MLVLRQIIIKFCRHQVITFTLYKGGTTMKLVRYGAQVVAVIQQG
jgi:hypothetical protein